MGAQLAYPKFDASKHLLTQAELEKLLSVFYWNIILHGFKPINPQAVFVTENQLWCSREEINTFFTGRGLNDWLTVRLSDILAQKTRSKNPYKISFEAMAKLASKALKGDRDEKIRLLFELCQKKNPLDDFIFVTGEEIGECVKSFLESFIRSLKNSSLLVTSASIKLFANYLLRDLFYPSGVADDPLTEENFHLADLVFASRKYTLEDLKTGLSNSMLFLNIHDSVFSHCFGFEKDINYKNLIPPCLNIPQSRKTSTSSGQPTLLDLTRIMFLNYHLPVGQHYQWNFLFSTIIHGESFSELVGRIRNKGPTITIVADTTGGVFGGFAAKSWSPGSMYESSGSFLFHLSPKLMVYDQTLNNGNFQYLNMFKKTMRNGLGIGIGTLGYQFWIDEDFGSGVFSPSCKSCSEISVGVQFTFDHLEVWEICERWQ